MPFGDMAAISPRTLADISPKHVRAFTLCASGLTQKEASARMGVQPGAVGTWLKELGEMVNPPTHGLEPAGPITNTKWPTRGNGLFGVNGELLERGKWVKEHLLELDRALRNLEKQVSPQRQVIGFSKSCTGLMNEVLIRLTRQFPLMHFDLVADSSATLARAVVSGRVDAAVIMDEVRERVADQDPMGTLCKTGGFALKSRLFVSRRNTHPVLATVNATRRELTTEAASALFKDPSTRWVWYDRKYLPSMYSGISLHMMPKEDQKKAAFAVTPKKPAFVVTHPVHDQESMYTCLVSNRGMAILPEAVEHYKFPGIMTYSLPEGFPRWEFAVVRHESNSHPFVQATCEVLAIECAALSCANNG